MSKEACAASNRLRRGRCSVVNQIYLVTAVTQRRARVFEDLSAARTLILTMREDARWGSHETLALVVMPDHLHWLLQLQKGSLSELVGRVKSISARRLDTRVWQDGFHDRALRDEDDLQAVARYIVANPLRAGLVERIGRYPHWDAV
ncbi:REP-associated tyrosine transposase [Stutzerimonas decontaminans]|uniref:REP-associated tyrosine transposase n=1 Tax=Stutzerimonas decontaminans TaxID=3022791 RepID=UPI00057207E4|nr:transposase [Stutzerimonas decontaminans]